MHRSRLALVGLLVTIGGAACGSDGGASSATSAGTVAPTGSVATTITPTTTAQPTTVPTTAPAPTTVAPTTILPTTTTIPTGPQPCSAASLALAAGPTDGAMGSAYTPLLLTNTGIVVCTLSTHIVMTFLDTGGQALGVSVATPEATGPGLVDVAPGESRQAVFRYSQPGNFPCDAYAGQSTLQLVVNQTETLTLAPMDWPICPDRLPDQVSLLDLDAIT